MMIVPQLAQKIVERSMKVLPFNVNVMDARGIIIASGNPQRIGDLHSGAQMVLARQEAVEIDTAAASSLPGAKAGINLPLYGRGEICGVIGITGNPEETRQYGELLRITAEMMIEQALLTGELQRERRYREEFVFQLLKRSGVSAESMSAWAARLGVDLTQARVVTLLRLESTRAEPDHQLLNLQRAQNELIARWNNLLTAVISPRELALLEAFDTGGTQAECLQRAQKRLAEIDRIVAHSIELDYSLTAGIALPGLDGASASYQSAKTTLSVARSRGSTRSTASFYEYPLPVLLADLELGWKQERFLKPLERLASNDPKSGVLIKTLAAWFANNGHPTLTAKTLHIHRNSLDYRLRKIGEITGMNLDSIDDMLMLYVGMQLMSRQPEAAE